MSSRMPAINVWASLNHEAALDSIDRQARDVEETCAKALRLTQELRTKAKKGDHDARRALAVLVDGIYDGLAESLMEMKS